jgi:hypothetical protein
LGFGSSNWLTHGIRLAMATARVKGNSMEQVSDTAPLSHPPRTLEALGVVEYNARASDIASGQLGAGACVLHLAELPSRRWLIEASRP